MKTPTLHRRAAALVRACYYWQRYVSHLSTEEAAERMLRIYDALPPVSECADADLKRCRKALRQVGDPADVLAEVGLKAETTVYPGLVFSYCSIGVADATARRALTQLVRLAPAAEQRLTLHDFRGGKRVEVMTNAAEEATAETMFVGRIQRMPSREEVVDAFGRETL